MSLQPPPLRTDDTGGDDTGGAGHEQRPGAASASSAWTVRARAARKTADALAHRATAAVVDAAATGGAGIAMAADRAGPVLDRIDDAVLPAAGRALESVAAAAATVSRTTAAGLLRLAARARLLPTPAGSPPMPRRSAPAAGGPIAGDGVIARDRAIAHDAADEPSVGRALLERGARIVVLGLVAMIVLSAAAALLPGLDGQPRSGGGADPAGPGGNSAGGQGSPPSAAVVPGVTIGPPAGESTADYIGGADQSLASLTQAAPAADLLAVVSLAGYRSPDSLQALLSTYRLTRVFFTVPGSGAVHEAAVRTPVDDVLAAFAAQATAAGRRATTDPDPGARERARVEADAYSHGRDCSCLFAAVLRAPAARLLALRQDTAVRVIDAAPPATLDNAVRFVPLVPDHA